MKDRSLSTFLLGAGAATALCLAFVHRRVIKAALTGEPMPEAPDWHCWVKDGKLAACCAPEDEALFENAAEAAKPEAAAEAVTEVTADTTPEATAE